MLTQTNNSGRAVRLSLANLARTQLGSRTRLIRLLVFLLELECDLLKGFLAQPLLLVPVQRRASKAPLGSLSQKAHILRRLVQHQAHEAKKEQHFFPMNAVIRAIHLIC